MTALTGYFASRKPVPPKARTLQQPRNAAALLDYRRQGYLQDGDGAVVSFVGKTHIDAPHVFVDSGRAYDWSVLAGLHVSIAVAKGVDARAAMASLYRMAPFGLQPCLVDLDAQHLAWVVSDEPLTLLPAGRGSASWANLFS